MGPKVKIEAIQALGDEAGAYGDLETVAMVNDAIEYGFKSSAWGRCEDIIDGLAMDNDAEELPARMSPPPSGSQVKRRGLSAQACSMCGGTGRRQC